MKKFVSFLLTVVLALFIAAPVMSKAEAATLVLLPLYNHTENEEAGRIFFVAALDALKTKKLQNFELQDNDAINDAIAKYTDEEAFPDSDALKKIARAADVDVVLGFELNVMNDDETLYSHEEDYIFLRIQGNVLAYNNLTGRVYKQKIYVDKKLEQVFTSRWNPLNEEWAKQVRLETERALTAKGK